MLSHQLDDLQTSHNRLVTALNSLDGSPTNQDVINKTVECCLRPESVKLANCPFCKADELFDDYEGKLYCFVAKGVETVLTGDGDVEGKVAASLILFVNKVQLLWYNNRLMHDY